MLDEVLTIGIPRRLSRVECLHKHCPKILPLFLGWASSSQLNRCVHPACVTAHCVRCFSHPLFAAWADGSGQHARKDSRKQPDSQPLSTSAVRPNEVIGVTRFSSVTQHRNGELLCISLTWVACGVGSLRSYFATCTTASSMFLERLANSRSNRLADSSRPALLPVTHTAERQ